MCLRGTSDLELLRDLLARSASKGGANASAYAINAVQAFLLDLGFSDHELRPLFVISLAFADHAEGKPNPLFQRAAKAGGRSHQADINFKICVAATMTMLQKSGIDKRGVAATITRTLGRAGIRVQTKTVDGWHREITRLRSKNPLLFASYQQALTAITAQPNRDRALRSALNGLSSLHRERI